MRSRKEFKGFVASLGLALTLVGCGGGDEPSGADGFRGRSFDFGQEISRTTSPMASGAGATVVTDGTVLQVAPTPLAEDGTVELVHSAFAGAALGVGDHVFYAVADQRPQPPAAATLSIPVAFGPVGVPPEQLVAFELQAGLLLPLPSVFDPATGAVVVSNPPVNMSRAPADPLRTFHQDPQLYAVKVRPGPSENNEAPTGVVLGAATAVATGCTSGAPGEFHDEPTHLFRIIFQVQSTCEFAQFISTTLMEAVGSYNQNFPLASGAAPFAHLTPENRMKVYLGSFKDKEGTPVNGEYRFLHWTGYIEVDAASAAANRTVARDVLFHEMFHAVQDLHANMFYGGVFIMWWYEATAEWAGLVARGLNLEQAARLEMENYKDLMSIPIQQSRSFHGGLASYGFSTMIYAAEARTPGYVNAALQGWSTRSAALYTDLNSAADFGNRYGAWVATMMRGVVPQVGIWLSARIFDTDTETRVFTPPSKTIGDGGQNVKRLMEEDERYTTHRFSSRIEGLTSRFYLVATTPGTTSRRIVNIKVKRGGTLVDHAMAGVVAPGAMPGSGSFDRITAMGQAYGSVGPSGDLWIGVFNPDPDNAANYEIELELSRADLRDPIARCRNGEYDAAFDLYKEGVDIGVARSDGDAYIMTATCAFGFGDYPNAETYALRGASASSRGGRAHNLFIAEYAAERLGNTGAATSHGDAGLEAARSSGQCSGVSDMDELEICALQYRASIRAILERREMELM